MKRFLLILLAPLICQAQPSNEWPRLLEQLSADKFQARKTAKQAFERGLDEDHRLACWEFLGSQDHRSLSLEGRLNLRELLHNIPKEMEGEGYLQLLDLTKSPIPNARCEYNTYRQEDDVFTNLGAKGDISFRILADGKGRVRLPRGMDQQRIHYLRIFHSEYGTAVARIESKPPKTISLNMLPKTTKDVLKGHVLDVDGAPIPNAFIECTTLPQFHPQQVGLEPLEQFALSDSSGAFRLPHTQELGFLMKAGKVFGTVHRRGWLPLPFEVAQGEVAIIRFPEQPFFQFRFEENGEVIPNEHASLDLLQPKGGFKFRRILPAHMVREGGHLPPGILLASWQPPVVPMEVFPIKLAQFPPLNVTEGASGLLSFKALSVHPGRGRLLDLKGRALGKGLLVGHQGGLRGTLAALSDSEWQALIEAPEAKLMSRPEAKKLSNQFKRLLFVKQSGAQGAFDLDHSYDEAWNLLVFVPGYLPRFQQVPPKSDLKTTRFELGDIQLHPGGRLRFQPSCEGSSTNTVLFHFLPKIYDQKSAVYLPMSCTKPVELFVPAEREGQLFASMWNVASNTVLVTKSFNLRQGALRDLGKIGLTPIVHVTVEIFSPSGEAVQGLDILAWQHWCELPLRKIPGKDVYAVVPKMPGDWMLNGSSEVLRPFYFDGRKKEVSFKIKLTKDEFKSVKRQR